MTRQAGPGRCVYCQASGGLETINAAGSLACRNTVTCQLRADGIDPAELLLRLARSAAREAPRLGTCQLAGLVAVLKPAVAAFEAELYPRADQAEALAQAARDHAPRRR